MTLNDEHDRLAAAVREAVAAKEQARTSPGVMGWFDALDAEQLARANLAAFKERVSEGLREKECRENGLRAAVVQAALFWRQVELAYQPTDRAMRAYGLYAGGKDDSEDALITAVDALLAFMGEEKND